MLKIFRQIKKMWYHNNMKTKLFIFLLAIFAVASFGYFDNKIVFATESADSICYVSLGDSIAVGYNLPNYDKDVSDANGETAGQFVQDSYAYKFKTLLENKYGANNVKSTTYATSGDAGADLLEKLENSTIQNTLKNGMPSWNTFATRKPTPPLK